MNIFGQQQTGKDHENGQKSVFFFIIDAEKTRYQKFQNNFQWVLLKISKIVTFEISVFSFDSMSEGFLLEQKPVKKIK